MKEWHRTMLLLILLAIAIITVIWLRIGMEDHAVEILR